MSRALTRGQSAANDERAASPEVSSDYVIDQRKKKKQFYRVLGARVESYEVSHEANKCPAVQIQGQNFAENLMVAPKSKRVIGLTEEGLDDWFAQSQNRKIENLLLSKKEYFVPHQVSEGIRNRWSHKPRLFSIETSELQEGHEKRFNSLYHDHVRISPRSILQDPHKLLFEYAKLDPKPVVNGTVIRHQNAHVPIHLHNSPQKVLTSGAQIRKRSSMNESPIKASRPGTQDLSFDVSSTEDKRRPSLFLNQSMNTQSLPARKPSGLRSRAQSRTKATDLLGIPGSSQSSKKPQLEEYQVSLASIKGIESRSDIKNTVDTQDDRKRYPYYKNAADMLRDEELMKENEDFLQELITKLHRKQSISKIEKTKSTEEDENKYNCDIRSQQIKFQRNVQQRLAQITDEQKKEISEIMSSSSASQLPGRHFSHSPQKPNKKPTSSESPQKVIVLFKGKRSESVKPSSPEKITRAAAERRKILQSKRSINMLNNTFDSGSQKTVTNFMESPGYHSKYDFNSTSQPKPYRFSTEAKARIARRFLDNSYSSAASQSPRRISMSDTENQLRLRMEQEINRKVVLALHRVDNQAVPIQFSSQATENTPHPQIRELNLSIEPMNIEQIEETLPIETVEEGGFLDFFKKRNEYIDPEAIAQVKPSGQEKITFWLTRGNLQIAKGNFHNAIDCYKQVLLINSQQFVCIFNIGCMFERLENYEAAKKWLQLCYDLSFCREECLYGLALCAYKSGAPQQCHFYLQELSKLSDKENPNVNYLIALSCKETGKNAEAAKFYFKVFQEIQKNIGFDFAKKIFASLLLGAQDIPFAIDAREAKNFFDSSKEYLVSKPSTLVFEGMYTSENEWKPDLLDAVTEKLVDMKFWKRFSKEYLRTFLGYMHVEKFKTDTILFCPTDYVYIMASGSISFRDHSPGPLNPKIIATLEEGDIIGFSPIDNDIYKKIENWMICRSEVEVLAIRITDFAQIWEAQKSVKKMIHTDIIEQTVLLRGITQQTLYTITYELAKKEVFRAGDVLYNDHSYMTAQDFNSKVKKKILNYKFYELIDKDDPTNQAYLKDMAARDEKISRPRGTSRTNRKISFNKVIAQSKIRPNDSLRQNGPPRLEENIIRGMFIILSGECTVENGEKRVVTTLTRGDYFGENLLLGTVGHNNFGLIRCKTPEVEVLHIAKTLFNRIPKYDVERMIEVCSEVKRNKRRMNHLRPPSHGVL